MYMSSRKNMQKEDEENLIYMNKELKKKKDEE